MLGDLKFCFMFVILCLSMCFRNVGCWHVPVLGPIAFAQGSKKSKVSHRATRGGSMCSMALGILLRDTQKPFKGPL